jgi:hypothetical protein
MPCNSSKYQRPRWRIIQHVKDSSPVKYLHSNMATETLVDSKKSEISHNRPTPSGFHPHQK